MKKIFTFLCVVLTTIFIVKADNATFNWALISSGAGADYSADVVTDVNGNIFLASYFGGSATFNGVQLDGSPKGTGNSNFDNSLFVSKISPSKTTLWSIYSNVGVVTPTALATTPAGDLIVTGTIRAVSNGATTNANIIDALGTVTTFTGLNISTSYAQSFVAKFNANGAVQWVKELNSGTAKDKAVTTNGLAADANGNVYLTGIYTTTVVLPAPTLVTLTSTNTTQAAFITKLDGTTGNEIWYRTSSGAIVSEILSGLTFGDDGFLYAAGIYRNATTAVPVTIGDKTFTPTSGYGLTMIKLDTDGNISYIQSRSNASDTRVKDVFVRSGKVFVAGSLRGDNGGLLFPGGTALTSTAAYLNGFTAVFDSNTGNDIWQKAILSSGIIEVYGITIGSDNRLYAFGTYANKTSSSVVGPVDFGNSKTIADTQTSNTQGDLFLVSYNVSNGTTLEIHSVASSSTFENAKSITCYGNNLYMLGGSNATSIDFGNNNIISGRTASFDFLLINYTVANPSTGVITSDASKLPFSYSDNANRLVVVKNAGNVKSARIIDATGRSIKIASNNNNDVLNIDAQGIASGVYLLQLTASDSQITSQRLIIR